MCGILGFRTGTGFDGDLVGKNRKRGGGAEVSFTTPHGTFFHFRAPTTGCSLHNLSEAYPLVYKQSALIGNGIINATMFNSIKDEDNNNDLYYILKRITLDGYKFLETVDGCFALVWFLPTGDIYLIRNTYPLYYSKNTFSSVPFDGGKLLEEGVLYNWTEGRVLQKIKMKEAPYLL